MTGILPELLSQVGRKGNMALNDSLSDMLARIKNVIKLTKYLLCALNQKKHECFKCSKGRLYKRF